MRCFSVTIKNDASWVSDGSISVEVMVLAEDFITATMKAHEIADSLKSKLESIAEGSNLGKDLSSLRVLQVQEICAVVSADGVGTYRGGFRSGLGVEEAVQKLTARLAKAKD